MVVCTHDRAVRLKICLASLAAQTLPAKCVEIVVVDDGSTDDTPEVCQEAAGRMPNLKVIRQSNAGLGAARNRGWEATQAPFVAFLDDDAIAPPFWLERLMAIWSEMPGDVACVGGPVEAEWGAPPPSWLTPPLALWLTVWSRKESRVITNEGMAFAGANMAFRREALAAVGGFSIALGRKGSTLLSHEESDLWERLRNRRWQACYDAGIPVRHYVSPERLRPAWFRQRLFWEGVSITRRETPLSVHSAWRRRAQAARIAIASLCSPAVLSHAVHPSRWGRTIDWQCHVSFKLGCARELWRMQ